MKKSFFLPALAAGLMLLSSCATSIQTTVQRPAELNLNGANSISILPFQTSAYGDEAGINILGIIRISFGDDRNDPKVAITDYLTHQLQDSLLNSGYMQVIGSKLVESAIVNGTNLPVDCYLSGYITRYNSDIESVRHENDDEEVYYKYERKMSFDVVYQVIDASTNAVISSKYKTISQTSSEHDRYGDVPDSFSLVKSKLDNLVSDIMKELQPYEETKYLKLLDDKNNKDAMNAAKDKAKNGLIQAAQEDYMFIYNTCDSFEAGYNAAELLLALGDLDGAEALMEEVYIAWGDKKAGTALNDIRVEKIYAEKLNAQLELKEAK